jgi:hypothetical protein
MNRLAIVLLILVGACGTARAQKSVYSCDPKLPTDEVIRCLSSRNSTQWYALTGTGTYTGVFTSLASPYVSALTISDDKGKLVVEISMDGSVKFGPGFTAQTAAKEFWTQISKAYPEVCVRRAPPVPETR